MKKNHYIKLFKLVLVPYLFLYVTSIDTQRN